MSCPLCERVELMKAGKYPYLIHEFKHSFLMLGDHQFFNGYSVLVSKQHYKEITDFPDQSGVEFFQEMMMVSRAIEKTFTPTKMNMCSLGNVCPHVHVHFFPRYADDPEFLDPPWLRMKRFEEANITPEQAVLNIKKIKDNL